MCGCMFLHATMNHTGQHTIIPTPTEADTTVVAGKQHCKHCGFPVDQDFSFCPGCGSRLGAAPCPACGQKVEASWGMCAYCGYPLGEEQGQSTPR